MEILEKHITDLARRSFERGYATFSEFLNIEEISTVKALSLPCSLTLYGGYEDAERRIAAFGETESYPIVCVKIQPLNQKFADKLNHRDFLGSLMNLGINRNTLGDIIVKDNEAYLFCLESISGYIVDSLTRVKHTSVKCELLQTAPEFVNELPEESEINVSSNRADSVIASVYKMSRSSVSSLFSTSKVFINSKLCTKDSTALKEKDKVTVRGFGKFIYEGELRHTKKDRLIVSIRKYE